MNATPTPGDQLIEQIVDPESVVYNSDMASCIGDLRECKQQSLSAPAEKFDYRIYFCCMCIYEGSRNLVTGNKTSHVVAVGKAVIQEFERALPFTSEGSAARKGIERIIRNVRTGVERFQQKVE